MKGRPSNFARVLPTNRWLLYADKSACPEADFEEQMDALLAIVTPQIEKFKSLCNRYTCNINCVLEMYFNNGESIPSIHLDKRHIEFMETLTAEFDVDIYCFRKTARKIK